MKKPGLNQHVAERVRELAAMSTIESYYDGYGDGFIAGVNSVEARITVPAIDYAYYELINSQYPYGYVQGVMEGIAWAKGPWLP